MLNSVKFTDAENEQVDIKIKGSEYSAKSWSDDDIDNIKTKIKKHYLKEQKNTCPYCKQKIKSNHGRH